MQISLILSLTIFFINYSFAQSGTEIYLFDINKSGTNFEISNPENISANDGYDNQPSFFTDDLMMFTSTRNNQTDIRAYAIEDGTYKWMTNTPEGSEYSPIHTFDEKYYTSIRLDEDGKQLLYKYDMLYGVSEPVFEDLVIGYHVWADKKTLVSFVLGDESSLVVSDVKKKKHRTIEKNIGRALFKIPGTNLISFISKEKRTWEIKSLDPKTGKTNVITNTLIGSEDMCWTPDGTILMGQGSKLFKLNPTTDDEWIEIASFDKYFLDNITRLAINPSGTKLAVVVKESPETIVNVQLEAYNNRDIDAFLATYADDIELFNFPNSKTTEGVEQMRLIYGSMFERVTNLKAEIKNRIVIGNKVIDEEYVTFGEQSISAVAIYEVHDGKISKVIFIKSE